MKLEILTFSSEVTRSICRVPSTWFSERLRLFNVSTSVGLGYGLSLRLHGGHKENLRSYFQEKFSGFSSLSQRISHQKKAFALFFRGRFTQRRFTERWNPWIFGDHGFHMILRYSCQHSHFRYLQPLFREIFANLRNVPLPRILFFRRFGVWL